MKVVNNTTTNRFYWIKLRTNFFSREDIDFLLSQKNGAEYVVLYQMLCLNTANNQGRLETKMGEIIIPYNAEKIVRDCKYFDIDTVNVAMSLYKKLGLIYEEEDKILKISNYEEMVGGETAWAEKKRLYRNNQKKLKCASTIEDNTEDNIEDNVEDTTKDNITDNVPYNVRQEYRDKSIEYRDKILDIDKEREIDNNISLPVPTSPSEKNVLLQYENEFEKLWNLYPNKKGKSKSLTKYILARKKGTTYEQVLKGINNYIKYIKKNKISLQYIKHGDTYFNNQCWLDEYEHENNNMSKNDEQWALLKGVYDGTIKINK